MKNAWTLAALATPALLLLGTSCAGDDSTQIIHSSAMGGSGGASPTSNAGPAGSKAGDGAGSIGASGGGTAPSTDDAGGNDPPVSVADAGGTDTGVSPSASICTPSGNQFDCNNVLSGMDGYLNRDDSAGPSQGADAPQLNCQNSETNPAPYKEKHWQLKGPGITAGKIYKVDLHFYGVVECKSYQGGSSPAFSDPNPQPSVTRSHNLWITGAKDTGDHWNTFAFTVTSASMSTLVGIGPQGVPLPALENTHALNQCPPSQAGKDITWLIDYDATIEVPGGSFINYLEYDLNCHMVANCGAAEARQTCDGPYNVLDSVKNAVPNTNTGFNQPIVNTSNPPSRGQWWLVDVKGVTPI